MLGAAGPSSVWAPGALPALALVSLSLKTRGGLGGFPTLAAPLCPIPAV